MRGKWLLLVGCRSHKLLRIVQSSMNGVDIDANVASPESLVLVPKFIVYDISAFSRNLLEDLQQHSDIVDTGVDTHLHEHGGEYKFESTK